MPEPRMCSQCGERPVQPRYARCFPCRYAGWPSRRPQTRRVGLDQERATATRRRKVLQGYGLTEESYAALLAAQGGVCAICGATPEDGGGKPNAFGQRHLFIDHVHATGEVRGLLCLRCNAMIGQAREDPAVLQAGADYVTRFVQNSLTRP